LLPWIITWSARTFINIQNQSFEDATTCIIHTFQSWSLLMQVQSNCFHPSILLLEFTAMFRNEIWNLEQGKVCPKEKLGYKQNPYPSKWFNTEKQPGPPALSLTGSVNSRHSPDLYKSLPKDWPCSTSAKLSKKKNPKFHMKNSLFMTQ
jgi:hypothetical protein